MFQVQRHLVMTESWPSILGLLLTSSIPSGSPTVSKCLLRMILEREQEASLSPTHIVSE